MWFTFAFWISLVATVTSGALVYLILRANIRKPGNLAAFVMFLGVFIWSFGELLERIAGPPPQDELIAYIGALTLCVGVFLTPAGLIHFGLDYPYRIKMKGVTRKSFLYLIYLVSIVGIALIPFNSLLNNFVIAGVNPYPAMGLQIWGLESGPVHKFFAAWTFIAAILLIFILILKLRGVDMDLVRKQILITLIGFLIMFFMVVFTSFLPIMMNVEMYPLNTLAFSIFGAFIMYTIFKYRMFLVAPSTEAIVESEKMPEEGIYPMDRDKAYDKFVLLTKSGNTGIAFVPEDPEKFKKKYGLKATTVFYITPELGKDRLNPEMDEHKEMIKFVVTSFLEQVYKPVILLDFSAKWISDDTRKTLSEAFKEISKKYGGVYFMVEPEKE